MKRKLILPLFVGFLISAQVRAGYDPTIGRWLSRDPTNKAELRQGANLYAYVGNDPVGSIDRFGLAKLIINGTSYSVTTRTEFIAALKGATATGDTIHDFLFNGHAFPDTGELILSDQKNLDDPNGVFTGNLLERYLERYSDLFDPNVNVRLDACGTANGPDSALNKFKDVFPDATVSGYTGFYLPGFGGVDNNSFFAREWGGAPGVPYHSIYVTK